MELSAGDKAATNGSFRNFRLTGRSDDRTTGRARVAEDATARLLFHSDGITGYETLFHGGPIDGTPKTGSLTAVRNLYRSLPNAGEGGVRRMLANDREEYEYFDEVKDLPFLRGVQGEGRR